MSPSHGDIVTSPHPLAELKVALSARRFMAAVELPIDSLRDRPEEFRRAIYLQCLSLAEMGQWSRVIQTCRDSMGDDQRDLQLLFLVALLKTGNGKAVLQAMSRSVDADADTEGLRCLMRGLAFRSIHDHEQSFACFRAAAFLSPSLIDHLECGRSRGCLQWASMTAVLRAIRYLPGLQETLRQPDITSACAYSRQNGGVSSVMRQSLLRAIDIDCMHPRRVAGQSC